MRLTGLGEETWSRTATWSQGQHSLLLGDQVVDTHRQGERNRARTAKAGARVLNFSKSAFGDGGAASTGHTLLVQQIPARLHISPTNTRAYLRLIVTQQAVSWSANP